MGQRRARQVHEKEERRQEILAVALDLFKTASFQAITMAEIARKSRLSKGTIFIYFNTKEKLFLTLAEEGLLTFYEALDEALGHSKTPLSPQSLSALVVEALDTCPHLPGLLSILHTVLEHNVDRLALLRFKEFLAVRAARSARNLEHRLPFLGPGQGLELVFQIHGLILGVWQMCDPTPMVKELLQTPGLYVFDMQFRPFFQRTLAALVRGLDQPRIFEPQRGLFEEPPDLQA